MQRIVPHKELDRLLDEAARDLDTFGVRVRELAEELDRDGALLEITSPDTWRRPEASSKKSSFAQQFRADVDAIIPLDREDEGRLARRIELARLRFETARAEESPAEADELDLEAATTHLSERVRRRAMELHALRTEMVERNLYLVLINVERYSQMGTSRLDLIQEGCISLFRAVDGFDWKRGLLFRTYAVHWLNQAFRNFLYNNGRTVRVPVYLQKALKHIDQAKIRLGDQDAPASEIAADSELNERLVQSAMRAARSSFSIDADGQDEEGSRFRDLLVDESDDGPYRTRFEDVTLEGGIEGALGQLSDREQHVIVKRFGLRGEEEHTLAEVAKELGVSVERVRQIQVRALNKLDTPGLRRDLDPFLN